jgi:hypothetical protein
MHTGQVYPVLARILEAWRSLAAKDVVARVGLHPEVHEMQVEGELVRVEVSATWASAKRTSVAVEAVAFGPAAWHTERVSERILVSVSK